MNTDDRSRCLAARAKGGSPEPAHPMALTGALWVSLCLAASVARAADPPAPPVLSPPIAGAGVPAAPLGSGQGVHDPRSAFKPLQERDGVVSWKLLGAVKSRLDRYKMVPTFTPEIQALNAKTVKVQGFMLPLDPGEKQRHFLLSAVPTSCNFCVPAGPEGLIEIRTRTPVRVSVDAITVQGRFVALTDDPYGLFYRVADAELVR